MKIFDALLGFLPSWVPFAALGDTTASTQLVADMMTDDLINVLSRVPNLRTPNT